jgi:hypothetical protein
VVTYRAHQEALESQNQAAVASAMGQAAAEAGRCPVAWRCRGHTTPRRVRTALLARPPTTTMAGDVHPQPPVVWSGERRACGDGRLCRARVGRGVSMSPFRGEARRAAFEPRQVCDSDEIYVLAALTLDTSITPRDGVMDVKGLDRGLRHGLLVEHLGRRPR